MSYTITFKPGVTRTSSSNVFPQGFIDRLTTELNKARSNPRGYINIIKEYVNDYSPSEINETIQYLSSVQVCSVPLRINVLLNVMAEKWVKAQGPVGGLGHGDISARIRAENIPAPRGYAFAENISYGFTDPQDIVVAWIIDKGVPNRGHRHNIFRCDLDQLGIAYGPHTVYRNMVVNEYASGFSTSRKIGLSRQRYIPVTGMLVYCVLY